MPRPGIPLCTAPFTSFIVDPDKTVRPCCVWEGEHFGSLEDTHIDSILAGERMQETRALLADRKWPDGCLRCKDRAQQTGWSLQQDFLPGGASFSDEWNKGLTYIELNSTNLCNLACLHCSVKFSNEWERYDRMLNDEGLGLRFIAHHTAPDAPAPCHGGDAADSEPKVASVPDQLSGMDLSHLKTVMLKGGEPMMNRDAIALLQRLDELGVLCNVTVTVVTNGSVVNPKIKEFLSHAKSVNCCLSVDGVGAVQDYIRYGPSANDRIEASVHSLLELPQTRWSMLMSVMTYNVFTLPQVAEWWNRMSRHAPDRFDAVNFKHFVIDPVYLSVSALPDSLRQQLIARYEPMGSLYKNVIRTLKQPFHGDDVLQTFVEFTRIMDRYRTTSVTDAVPELAPLFVTRSAR